MVNLSINTNIFSLVTGRNLDRVTAKLGAAMERLSSGLRINRASDDPAGLAVASALGLEQITLSQALENVNDGISLLNVASAAFQELQNITANLKELSLQAGNGTYSTSQLEALNDEYNALVDEYNRILLGVEFNGMKLVTEDGETQFTFQVDNQSDQASQISTSIGSFLGQSSEAIVGDGTFAETVSMAVGINPWEVALIDLDQDGNLDMIITDYGMGMTGYAQVAMGLGDGTFGAVVSFDTGFSTKAFAFGDVNNDSKLDIIAANNLPDAISVLLGNGNGTFGAATQYSAGDGPLSIAIGDVNGDSNLDVVTNNFYSSDMTVLIGVGDGTFAGPVTYAAGGGKSISLIDIDGDTYLDVLSATGASVSVMKGNGNGTFDAPVSFQADLGGVGDFAVGYVDADSNLDIVSVGDGSGQINVLLGNGGNIWSTNSFYWNRRLLYCHVRRPKW